MKLKETINLFVKTQKGRGNSEKTVNNYKQRLTYFQKYVGNVEIDTITIYTIYDYIDYLRNKRKNEEHPYTLTSDEKLSSTTVQSYIREIKAFIRWCIFNDYLKQENFKDFKLPKAKQSIVEILDVETIKQIYNFCDKYSSTNKIRYRNKIIISLMLDSGLRANEVATLRIEDINLKKGLLKVNGKGNKQRYVPFGKTTGDYLKFYKRWYIHEDKGILLINEYGNPVGYYGIKKLFQKIRKYTKKDYIHPHLLRHTFGTLYLMNGGDIESLKIILGHTTLKMVEHYLHLSKEFTIGRYKQYCVLDNIKV